jgi:hypothetical protein
MIKINFRCDKCASEDGELIHNYHPRMICNNCHESEDLVLHHKYLSKRGIPLVTQYITGWSADGEPKPHLTVENYEKWYGAYIIRPDNTIEELTFGDFEGAIEGPDTRDHCINPSSFHATAKKLNVLYDDRTFALVCERWVEDYLDGDWTKPHKYLPRELNKNKEPEPIEEIKTGPFEGKGEEEVGKVFTARRRCPSYEKAHETISPGDQFKIFWYHNEDGIYHLENITRPDPGRGSYVGEEELRDIIDPQNTFTLELASKPGVPNVNGRVYTQEAFDIAKEHVKKRINMGLATARIGIPVFTAISDILITNPRDEQFTILSIDEDSATLAPIQMDKYEELQSLMEENKYVLAMNYIGQPDENNVINKMTIGSFSLIPKPRVRVEKIFYYVNGEKFSEEPMIFKRLYAIGDETVIDSQSYKVKRVEVKDAIQHVYMGVTNEN